MKRGVAMVLGMVMIATLGSSQMRAHHAFSSTYDRDKVVKIEGTLKEFLWRNPHSYVRVEAPDDKGDMQIWVVEWAAPAQLTENGLTSNTLRPGDKLIVTGHPGRAADEKHPLKVRKGDRPSHASKSATLAPN